MKRRFVTDEEKQIFIKSDKSNVELGKIYGYSPKTISKIRIEAGKPIGIKKCGNWKLTDSDVDFIMTSELKSDEVAKILNTTYKTVNRYRKQRGYICFRKKEKPQKKRVKKEKIIKPKKQKSADNPEKLKLILDPYLSLDEISNKTGLSKSWISEIRKSKGVRKMKKISKSTSDNNNSNFIKTEIKASMSHHEQNYIIKKQADILIQKQIISDSEKIANGTHKWQCVEIYGKKTMVLKRVINDNSKINSLS